MNTRSTRAPTAGPRFRPVTTRLFWRRYNL